jgi:hypothetical protein
MGANIREAELSDFEKITELLEQLWPDKELNRSALLNVFSTCVKSPDNMYLCAVRMHTGFMLKKAFQKGPTSSQKSYEKGLLFLKRAVILKIQVLRA